MCAKMAFQHQAGTAMECLSIPITLHKETEVNENGEEVMKCGFKIGGGIDQDFRKSPQGYTDNGIYVTEVHEGSPAAKSGLRMHDKILQCNGAPRGWIVYDTSLPILLHTASKRSK
ncbi:tax1-binding protein 3 homolog isoform X2 [Hylaeus anthracinus]|uniref:tax1-binding protein 3 homolog isoform X2 n=1 Tax=Hylaeus volcanicus TaxID=313075 RepID=UPI0023B7D33C|nr:tax1-binding protein 3 homolog isoform X2 [Hylaeus volcanicus]XP_054007138.1 tax1-binding protein 3 homolog isoform X2 [Hylaeus anthracinus]